MGPRKCTRCRRRSASQLRASGSRTWRLSAPRSCSSYACAATAALAASADAAHNGSRRMHGSAWLSESHARRLQLWTSLQAVTHRSNDNQVRCRSMSRMAPSTRRSRSCVAAALKQRYVACNQAAHRLQRRRIVHRTPQQRNGSRNLHCKHAPPAALARRTPRAAATQCTTQTALYLNLALDLNSTHNQNLKWKRAPPAAQARRAPRAPAGRARRSRRPAAAAGAGPRRAARPRPPAARPARPGGSTGTRSWRPGSAPQSLRSQGARPTHAPDARELRW